MLLTPETMARLRHARVRLRDVERPLPDLVRLARELGVSQFHLIRQFNAVFGVTPHQCRIDARLERARQLLAAGHTVTDVCFEIGASSLGTFSAQFTRHFGEPASSFRRRARSMVTVPGHRLPSALTPGCLGLMAMLPADAWVRLKADARLEARNFEEAPSERIGHSTR